MLKKYIQKHYLLALIMLFMLLLSLAVGITFILTADNNAVIGVLPFVCALLLLLALNVNSGIKQKKLFRAKNNPNFKLSKKEEEGLINNYIEIRNMLLVGMAFYFILGLILTISL